MMRKLISVICILALFFTSAVPAFAWELQVGNGSKLVYGETLQVNPYYQDVIDQENLKTELDGFQQYAIQPLADDNYCTTKSEVSDVLREAMVHRENNISVQYINATPLTKADLTTMMDSALAETNQPNEGDYLAFQYGGWKGSYKGYNYFGTYYLTVTYTITYYTTLEQEKELDAALEDVLMTLHIDEDADDYEKVCAIYDYICNHVTYDYDHLEDDDYKLQFTAYAALVNGTSVCQGYANLFYRMAKELGLSTRIIRGWQTSTGGGHAWNIVKLGDMYYNLDATWDAVYADAGLNYAFFLKGYNPFDNHTFRDEYISEEFLQAYPMATEAYVYNPEEEPVVKQNISEFPAYLETDHFVYDGSSKEPAVVIDGLEYGIDYEVNYTDNLNAGQGSAVAYGIGNFCGEITLPFTIEKANIANEKVSLDQDVYYYVGKPVNPVVDTGNLIEGKDYDLSYDNNHRVGTGTVILTGKGNYTGTAVITFEILECAHQWDAGKVTTEPDCNHEGVRTYTCKLCQGEITEPVSTNDSHNMSGWKTEKEASCSEGGLQINVCQNGCGLREEEVLPATGKHSFTKYVSDNNATCTADGTKTAKCNSCAATNTVKAVGSAKGHVEKKVVTKASKSVDGKIVTTCSVCKKTLKSEVIPKIKAVKLSYSQKVYTGKAIAAPKLTVTDRNGKAIASYSVSGLTKKTKTGRYKVTVTFSGNYTGSEVLYFTIVPKKVSSATANLNSADTKNGYNDIRFSWKASSGASGYLVYYKKASASKWSSAVSTTKTYYTKKNLASGTKYTFKVVPYYKEAGKTTKYYDAAQYRTASTTTLKKVTGVKVVKSGTKVKVSWTNISGETGYQISKSTKKSTTQKVPTTVKSTTAKSKLLSATKGKTYYYRVRAYKVVSGKKVYGPWSDVKLYRRK